MKKLLIIGSVLLCLSATLGIAAVASTNGDFSKLYNFGNYNENKQSFTQTNIVIENCENIEIKESRSDDASVIYYTNSNSKYNITTSLDTLYIKGDIEDSFFDSFQDKGLEVYLPTAIYQNVTIVADDAKIDIENVTLNTLYITADDCNIEVTDSTINNLNLNLEDCNLELDDVISTQTNITADDCNIEIDLPYKKDLYYLDINVDGNCNVSSSGDALLATYSLTIKAIDSKVDVEFN